MSNTTGRRHTKIADPTAERSADPIPDGEDILARDEDGRLETPRRYDQPDRDADLSPNEPAPKTPA
jgi:hypothetical protein